jgi:hypothetical protein
MHRADIDKLRTLAGLLKPLADLPEALDAVASVEQAVREGEARLAKITADCIAKQESAAKALTAGANAALDAEQIIASAHAQAAEITEQAQAYAKATQDDAGMQASRTLKDAAAKAEEALNRAKTIDQSIASRTAECARIEKKIADARNQLKKMLES